MINRAFILVAMLASGGCLGSALTSTADGGSGGGGGGGTVDMAPDVVGKFYSDVAPILKPACGGCHGVTGQSAPAFMLDSPDMLQNLLMYPGIIGATPEKSRLYMKGQHEGPAFTPDQAPVIRDWITFYNANRPMTDGGMAAPTIAPFTPQMGTTNTIDLAALDSSLTGMKLTFSAKMVGTSQVELSSITLAASSAMGVHVAHPLFVVWDQNLDPHPDPVDSFSTLDETVFSGQTAPLGPGTLILPYTAGSLLNVVFTTIEAKMGSTDGGTVTGCKALSMFVQNVKPILVQNGCASNCHNAAMMTAGLNWATTPDSALCQVALTEINKTTPANSPMLIEPNPGPNIAPTHTNKINPFTAYQTAVTNWINAEK